jgi:hypothetical protein
MSPRVNSHAGGVPAIGLTKRRDGAEGVEINSRKSFLFCGRTFGPCTCKTVDRRVESVIARQLWPLTELFQSSGEGF